MKAAEFKKLGDYVKIKTGKLDANASSDDGEYPFFTCSIEPLKISSFSYDCECCLVAGNGDLNVKYYNGKFDAYQRTYIIESLDKEKLDVMYLYFFLCSYIEVLRKQSIGGVIKYIKLGNLTDALIPIPSLEKQKKICRNLIKAQKVLNENQALFSKYDILIKSRFIEMFGDPLENNKKWDSKKLENLCEIVRGGSPRPIDKFLGGAIPWIKIGDATIGDDIFLYKTKEHIIEDGIKKSRLISEGSLIFANCGVSLGFARIIKFQGCIHDGWLAFQNIDASINNIFLLKSINMCTDYFRRTAPDGTQPNLNTTIMKNFVQIIPPIKLQEEYVSFVQQIDKSKFENTTQEIAA